MTTQWSTTITIEHATVVLLSLESHSAYLKYEALCTHAHIDYPNAEEKGSFRYESFGTRIRQKSQHSREGFGHLPPFRKKYYRSQSYVS